MNQEIAIAFAFAAPLFSIAFAAALTTWIMRQRVASTRMREVASAIKTGAKAFLNTQYKVIALISAAAALLIYFFVEPKDAAFKTAAAFALGSLLSALAGYVGMAVAVRANARTADAAQRVGLNASLKIAFRGGAVMGLSVVSLSLVGVALLYYLFGSPELVIGFGFGASLVALFAQLGGGIYTKSADVGADLVGKVEKGIPEDDPRNPAVIADNVGDNVGDCAGRGADLFESVSAENIGAMILGLALVPKLGFGAVLFPLAAGAVGLLATIAGSFFVRVKEGRDPMKGLNRGFYVATVLCVVAFYPLVQWLLGGEANYYYAALVGLATTFAVLWITRYYTSKRYRPVKSIAEASRSGHAVNVITGLAVGMEATALPALVLCAAVLAAFSLAGLYGTAVATVGMLSTASFVLAMDGFGPIADNAGGITQMSRVRGRARVITDKLDAAGNTAKALTKGYAMASATLAAFLLFAAYLNVANVSSVDVSKPQVFVGLFFGGMVPFLFSSLAVSAVGRGAFRTVEEVRRQFREIKGLLQGRAKPEYARCVDIVTKTALKGMVAPGLLAAASPVAVGIVLGAEAAGAFLMGVIVSGVLLAVVMFDGGGAWDNAKKYIEEGRFGGKGSEAHAAAVTGDTVGDPLKDTAGPSLHVLVKLSNTITLVFVGLFPR